VAAAVGELAERYSAAYVPAELLLLASADDHGSECLDPETIGLFAPLQYVQPDFPYAPFARDTPVRWVRGFSLPDCRPALLPAQLVFLCDDVADGETRIGYATSNGLACGPTLEEAILSGLLELVERDAFMLTWLNRLSLPLLDWAGDGKIAALDGRYFACTGLRYSVVDLSGFHGVPTALAVVHGADLDDAALGVGAASAPSMRDAWLKALAEAFAVRAWARTLRRLEPPPSFRPDFSDIRSFADHIRFYGEHRNARHAAFLDGAAVRRPTSAVPGLPAGRPLETIRELTSRLHSAGARAFAVDVTAPDIRAAGLFVAKVFSPELCPLDVAYETRFLGAKRIYVAAAERGLLPGPLELADLNPYPHPFP
jgi:ribosomal protein S12 methylthiotransferase accessory factor